MDGWHVGGGGKLMQGWGEFGQNAMSLPGGSSLMPAGVPAGRGQSPSDISACSTPIFWMCWRAAFSSCWLEGNILQ